MSVCQGLPIGDVCVYPDEMTGIPLGAHGLDFDFALHLGFEIEDPDRQATCLRLAHDGCIPE